MSVYGDVDFYHSEDIEFLFYRTIILLLITPSGTDLGQISTEEAVLRIVAVRGKK